MALAYLVHNMPHPLDRGIRAFSPHAFIVDHGARQGSRDEAIQVKEMLYELGIVASVLTINWPHGTHPDRMTGFEAAARQARYQLIVRGALSQSCYDLCTGHHLDDQMETILLRIIRNKTSNLFGLRGMASTSAVPWSNSVVEANPYQEVSAAQPAASAFHSVDVMNERYHHGIMLHRPLLPFSKSQLQATCKHFGVPYVIDKTNFDPTHNLRNTIRYVRSNSLPKALQNASLTAIRDRAVQVMQDAERRAIGLFQDAYTIRTHSQTGSVEIRVKVSGGYSDMLASRYLLARLIELVSPLPPEDRPTLITTELVQRLAKYDLEKTQENSLHNGILVSKVVVQALPISNVNESLEQRLILYRQPMRQAEIDRNTLKFTIENEEKELNDEGVFRSQYIFWDQRFWVRVSAKNRGVIGNTQIRPLERADVLKIRKDDHSKQNGATGTQKDAFDTLFIPQMPEKIKYTLPVLIYYGEVVALPTLGLVIGNGPCPLGWEVRWPHSSRAMTLFAPPTDLT